MGVALRLVNFDQLIRHARNEPVIINKLPDNSEEDKDRVNKLIYVKYTTDDLLSNLPTCDCGRLFGEYNLGVTCQVCHHKVVSPMDQDLEAVVWMRSPQGVAKLINPVVWAMLNEKFKRSSFEILRYMTDSSFKSAFTMPPVLQVVQELRIGGQKIPRSYNFFVEHFDEIIDKLFDLKIFRNPKQRGLDPLHRLIKEQRDCIFSEYLPLPNRYLLVIEDSNHGIYVDPIVSGAVDAIRKMVSIDAEISPLALYVKENRTIRSIHQLTEFYDGVIKTTLAKKEGIFRKHVYGTRSHFSFRAVISSLTDAHRYDELHIPWGIGTSVFKIHLVNKLFRGGPGRRPMTTNEAIGFLNEHAQKYHPLLDQLFQELINESVLLEPSYQVPNPNYNPVDPASPEFVQTPEKHGIPVVFQRNPSLERGSAQAMYVTRVKTDVLIPTVSLSILAVKGFNADFDGDQLNGTLSLDRRTHDALRALAPHMSTFDLNAPRKVSKNLSMPGPVVSTISNWMGHADAVKVDPEKAARMAQLPDSVH